MDVIFMISVPEFVIQEKTENYKQFVCNLTGCFSDPTDETKETVIFVNGMKATFMFRLYYVHDYFHYIQIYNMTITTNDEETQDPILKRKISDILHNDYFDTTILRTLDFDNEELSDA
jgi:hypothetical protein